MIKKEKILEIVNSILSEENEQFNDSELFLVDLKVSQDNKITIHVDSPTGVLIADCARLSRSVEGKLDREQNDFELMVSSAGLTQPFKVKKQYEINIGKQVKILSHDGERTTGKITKVTEKGIELKINLSKKKQKSAEEEIIQFDFELIKEAKAVITF